MRECQKDRSHKEHGHADESLFTWKSRLPIFLAVSIAMFNQLSGINAILYYLTSIFESAGFSKSSGDLQAIAIGAEHIMCGFAEVIIAGGVESMSMVPMGGNKTVPNLKLIEKYPEGYTAMGVTAET